MDYEQKYKNALERARDLMTNQNPPAFDKHLIEMVFPELKKESEDNKIKREIVAYINELADLKNEKIPTKWLDWLEKQGERKKPDDHKPKFKVGNWITNGRYTRLVVGVDSRHYQFENGDVKYIDDIDKKYHLWTIADAMDGDVLASKGKGGQEVGIVKRFIGKYGGYNNCFETYCYSDLDGTFRTGEYMGGNTIHPATKEQCDLLFQKMKEAGYVWDANKKELKKIESKTLDADEVIEWLKKTIRAHSENYGVYKATRLTLPYNSIEDLINDFKEDFGLC